ncbi:MAG: hypothetical protein JSU63_16370 [Phycisphaerales bacterium]|nr:MAG: hypothetical protein JSU63_16370 [Phycisphaerales bacterium]
MSNPDQEKIGELLSAYLDGELDAGKEAYLERLVAEDAGVRHLLEELRHTVEAVAQLPRHSAPPSIAEDVCSQLERSELLGDFESPGAAPRGRRSGVLAALSMAAVLTLVVTGWLWMSREQDERGMPASDHLALGPVEERSPATDDHLEDSDAARARRSPEGRMRRVAKKGEAGARDKGTPVERMGKRGAKSPRVAVREDAVVEVDAATPDRDETSQRTRARLLSGAPVEQKLAAGMSPRALRNHRFGNETIQLDVSLREGKQLDTAAARLTDYLATLRLADISTKKRIHPGRRRGAGSFFYSGKPGVNYDDSGQRQILVRVPAEELDGLLTKLVGETIEEENVALMSGPITVRGLENARNALKASVPTGEAAGPRSRRVRGSSGKEQVAERDERQAEGAGPYGAPRERVGLLEEAWRGISGQMPVVPPRADVAVTPQRSEPQGDAVPSPVLESVESSVKEESALARDEGAVTDQFSVVTDKPDEVRTAELGGKTAEGPSGQHKKRGSLVDRRSEALEEESRRREAGEARVASGEAAAVSGKSTNGRGKRSVRSRSADSTAERYVTLVVRFKVEEPVRASESSRDSAGKARASGSSPAKTSRTAKPAKKTDPAKK